MASRSAPAARRRALLALAAALAGACQKASGAAGSAAPAAGAPAVSLASLDSEAVARLAAQYQGRAWLASLPAAGTVTGRLDAAAMTRAFARPDSSPVVFAGTVTSILARAGGKVVVVEPDYHGADGVADFELWASCADSLAAIASRQVTMARHEVAVVSRVHDVQRLVWMPEDAGASVRDRYYVEGSCLALVPLPQSP